MHFLSLAWDVYVIFCFFFFFWIFLPLHWTTVAENDNLFNKNLFILPINDDEISNKWSKSETNIEECFVYIALFGISKTVFDFFEETMVNIIMRLLVGECVISGEK